MGRYGTGVPVYVRLFRFIKRDKKTGCWIWTGAKNNAGYGLIRDGNRMRTVHKVAYEEHHNVDVPIGQCVCHRCFNTLCFNPKHLWIGTKQESIDDMVKEGRYLHNKMPTSTCLHCGTEGPVNTHAKYHFDRCKSKPRT